MRGEDDGTSDGTMLGGELTVDTGEDDGTSDGTMLGGELTDDALVTGGGMLVSPMNSAL